MKWIIYILLFSLSASVQAVSMENETFALQADEIRFKLGQVTAKRQVTIRLKSPLVIQLLMNTVNRERLNNENTPRMVEIDLSGGWKLQGRIHSMVIEEGVVKLESDELSLRSSKLLAKGI